MKGKSRIALAALASLCLLSVGVTKADAKSINVEHSVHFEDPAQTLKSWVYRNVFKTNYQNHPLSNEKRNENVSNVNLNKGNTTKYNHNNFDSNHNLSHRKLMYYHTELPNKPLRDNNLNNISNMSHFIRIRRPYLYRQIGNNTRDLGGYPTTNHKYQTRTKRIIRSGDLDGISNNGIEALKQLHVNKIIDLRYYVTSDGIQGHPDPNELQSNVLKGSTIKYQNLPIYSHSEFHKFSRYLDNHDVRGEYYFYGAPSVNEPQAIMSYRRVFNDLLNNKHGAILFHCNLGRDRTGTTSALILSALGVSRNVIYHDYLLTLYNQDPYKIHPYSKQAGELSYFFKTIDRKYGSVHNYLHGPLGLSNKDIHKLRLMYLVPSNHKLVHKKIVLKSKSFNNKGHKSGNNLNKVNR